MNRKLLGAFAAASIAVGGSNAFAAGAVLITNPGGWSGPTVADGDAKFAQETSENVTIWCDNGPKCFEVNGDDLWIYYWGVAPPADGSGPSNMPAHTLTKL
jgi:hypothetical protein